MSKDSPSSPNPDEDFAGDEPYSYASKLAKFLSSLRGINIPAFDDETAETESESVRVRIGEEIRKEFTDDFTLIDHDDRILYKYPSVDDNESETGLQSQISVRVEYYRDGRVWVETKYADSPNKDWQSTYWTGWLSEYDEEEAYKMGALSAMHLFSAYAEAGMTPAQALDLGATTGIGYSDKFMWASRRDVDYEAVRKNSSAGRDLLIDAGWQEDMLDRDVHVARCGTCGRNMQLAASCDRSRASQLVDSNGDKYERLPFGNEDELTVQRMEEQGVDEEQIKSYKETVQRNPIDEGDRCHDCGVITGGIHHKNCDKEICPKCNGQLLSCDCDWKNVTGEALLV